MLTELLDLALPPAAIYAAHTGAARFAARFGFRVLDERLALLPGQTRRDISLDAASFAALRAPIRRVFITENETNFLAFPAAARGYGWEALAGAAWLHDCAIHYWVDIDTHGIAILDPLRSRFAHVRSFLMDRRRYWPTKRCGGRSGSR